MESLFFFLGIQNLFKKKYLSIHFNFHFQKKNPIDREFLLTFCHIRYKKEEEYISSLTRAGLYLINLIDIL